ncbi:hypothetical protein ZWY2020_052360 [Hordeum vulgare]|nr:hypothetical protein ZWY2020_052360 [Hordeum vulgare]
MIAIGRLNGCGGMKRTGRVLSWQSWWLTSLWWLGTGSPRLPGRWLLGLQSPDPWSNTGVGAGGTLRVRTVGMMGPMGPMPLLIGGRSVPRGGKLAHILKAISGPVGKLVTADLASFEDDGSARIEILCPAPAEINGLSLIFYFGTRGRHLTFELEYSVLEDLLGPAPASTVPCDDW